MTFAEDAIISFEALASELWLFAEPRERRRALTQMGLVLAESEVF